MADKGGFPHYMLKEIFEQPQGLRNTIQPRVSLEEGIVRLDDVRIRREELRELRAHKHRRVGHQSPRRHGRAIHDSGSGASCPSMSITPANLNIAIL